MKTKVLFIVAMFAMAGAPALAQNMSYSNGQIFNVAKSTKPGNSAYYNADQACGSCGGCASSCGCDSGCGGMGGGLFGGGLFNRGWGMGCGGCDTGCGGCSTGCDSGCGGCDSGCGIGRGWFSRPWFGCNFWKQEFGTCGGMSNDCGCDGGCGSCDSGCGGCGLFGGGLFNRPWGFGSRFGCGGCDSGCGGGCGGCGSCGAGCGGCDCGTYFSIISGVNSLNRYSGVAVPTTTQRFQEFDDGWCLGGAIGRKFGNGNRAELEFNYRNNRTEQYTLDQYVGNVLVASNNYDTAGKVNSFSGMFNVYRDLNALGNGLFTPYIGAGAGVTQVEADWTILGPNWQYSIDESAIAGQLMAGILVPLGGNVELIGEYRYFVTDKVDINNAMGNQIGDFNYENNSILLGLKINTN